MQIVAEAYRIRAVAFETPEEAADAEQEAAAGEPAAGTDADGRKNGEKNTEAKPPRKNDGSLDFGRQRAGDSAAQRFTLRNR